MDEPNNAEDVLKLHNILRSDPQRYMRIVNNWLLQNPNNVHAYFDRHFAQMNLGEPRLALEDMNRVVELAASPGAFLARGDVYRHLGEYDRALEDYNRGEAMDPSGWNDDAFGVLFQADCHARLGDEEKALAHCASLPDDFWTPGLKGAPAGDKARIADELRRMASGAQRARV